MVETRKPAPARRRKTAGGKPRPGRKAKRKPRVAAARKGRSRNFSYGRGTLAMFFVAAGSVWLMTSLWFAPPVSALSPLAVLAADRITAGGEEVLAAVCADFRDSLRERFRSPSAGETITLRPWIRRLADGAVETPSVGLPPSLRVVDGPSDWVKSVERAGPAAEDPYVVAADHPRLPIEP